EKSAICGNRCLRRAGGVSRFSPSEPAGLRVCRLSVFLWASSGGPTVRRVDGRLVTVVIPALLVGLVAWASGGYFPRTWGVLLLAEAIAVAAYALLGDRVEPDRRALVLVGALAGLAA